MKKQVLLLTIFTFITILTNFLYVHANEYVDANEYGIEQHETQIYKPQTYHHITWPFVTYKNPDFTSERLGFFAPQKLIILEEYDDGWVLIRTDTKPQWTNINGNFRYINKTTGLFENINDTHYVSRLAPQLVAVLNQQDNWIYIDTSQGPLWINLDFSPPTTELDDFLLRFGDNLSVFFKNIETGFVYQYNADRVYFSASVPKASFALYIYLLAEMNKTDLDSIHTFKSTDYLGGSGVIRLNHSVGATFTQRQLLGLNLYQSDNIATNILRRIHGIDGYIQFVYDIGGNPSFVGNVIMNSRLTANEAGLFAKEIFNYINSNGMYSQEFESHMLNNQFPFLVSDYDMLSKTGWTRPHAWHDMSIVYAPSPYILVVLSARNGWGQQDYQDFYDISKLFQNFNTRWFVQ